MNWNYIHISTLDEIIMSGWKLYIFGQDLEDCNYVGKSILPVCKEYNCTVKLATKEIIDHYNNSNMAWGIAIIYLHSELFQNNQVNNLIKSLTLSLGNYTKSGYNIGSKPINSIISARYELDIPVNPILGLKYEDYLNHYRGELGEYNPFKTNVL